MMARKPRRLLGLVTLCLGLVIPPGVSAQGPMGRPDPRQMSGLARVDPQVAPGTVTVRCLLGTFDRPAVGFEVLLEVRNADGSVVEEHTATTADQGRATFTGLEKFFGGQAVARVSFDTEEVRSQAIPIAPSAGSRVMLVKGAVSAPAGDPHAGGGSDLPLPGEAFPSDRFPAGTVVVGVLDLKARKPVIGVEVILRGTVLREDDAGTTKNPGTGEASPGEPSGVDARPGSEQAPAPGASDTEHASAGQPESGDNPDTEAPVGGEKSVDAPDPDDDALVRRQSIGEDGRAIFPNMLAAEIPQATQWVAEVTLPGSDKPLRSKPFRVFPEEGTAIYLAVGVDPGEVPTATAAKRRPLMPPRRMPTIQPGVVRVAVLDADDRPVADQPVQIIREDVTGGREAVEANTDASGVTRIAVEVSGDSLYYAQAIHDDAPFRSVRFGMNDAAGVGLELRVFETTSDLSRVRSEVQFIFVPRENNRVEVNQGYRVFVEGDEALWLGEDTQIPGADGALGFVVMNHATPGLLTHNEKAPFATLEQPIPPGAVADLSVAYLLEHDGIATATWEAPFPVVSGAAVMQPDYKLTAGSSEAPTRPPHQTGREVVDVYKLAAFDAGTSIGLEISDLPVNERAQILQAIGTGTGLLLFGGIAVLMLLGRRRANTRERLLQQREKLLNLLDAVDAAGGIEIPGVRRGGAASRPGAPAQRKLVIAALDRVYRDLDALDRAQAGHKPAKKSPA